MTKKKDPRDLLIQRFTEDDDQVFFDYYGTMPVKDLIPMMTNPHPLNSMYQHALKLDVSERKPLWKEPEKRLLSKALEMGMSYQVIAEASKNFGETRNMTEAGITQYLYRARKRAERKRKLSA